MIRQYTWKEWYYSQDTIPTPRELRDGDEASRTHVDHCIETLRLTLMCYSDTTPMLAILDPTHAGGVKADFSSHHKCRNFEKVAHWMEENQVIQSDSKHNIT